MTSAKSEWSLYRLQRYHIEVLYGMIENVKKSSFLCRKASIVVPQRFCHTFSIPDIQLESNSPRAITTQDIFHTPTIKIRITGAEKKV